MTCPEDCILHGTSVALAGRAALIRGASGAGKSDLALRFLSHYGADGGGLVADDRCLIQAKEGRLTVRSPDAIAGRIEVRGIGILAVPHVDSAELSLIVDLVASDAVPRMPSEPLPQEQLLDCWISKAVLAPFEASAPVKLKLLLGGEL